MKKNIIYFVVFIMAVMLLGSCSSIKVSVQSVSPELQNISSLGVSSVTISERARVFIPLVDAGIYNKALDQAEADFNAVNERVAPEITALLISEFQSNSGITPVEVDYDWSEGAFGEPDISAAAKLAADNNLDAIVVPYVRLVTTGVTAFGIRGSNYVKMSLHVISSNGTVLASGLFHSDIVTAGPKQISAYEQVLNYYKDLTPQLVELMYQ